jgi:hypothetical protein
VCVCVCVCVCFSVFFGLGRGGFLCLPGGGGNGIQNTDRVCIMSSCSCFVLVDTWCGEECVCAIAGCDPHDATLPWYTYSSA